LNEENECEDRMIRLKNNSLKGKTGNCLRLFARYKQIGETDLMIVSELFLRCSSIIAWNKIIFLLMCHLYTNNELTCKVKVVVSKLEQF